MISAIKNSNLGKVMWLIMGFQLLNISVDVADHSSIHISEDLSINKQESIIEIVIEKLIGFEDAIAEYDDANSENSIQKENLKIDFILTDYLPKNKHFHDILYRQCNYSLLFNDVQKGYHQLDTPPPKI